ncbi:MAG: AraC family transcriptional regulator [Treponema sp.]
MIYYKKIFSLLLGMSLFFVIVVDSVLLWNTVSRARSTFQRDIDGRIKRIAEFTDSRLAMNHLRTLILSSSDYLYRYVSKAPPEEYNLVVFSNYLKSLYTVTPAEQTRFAVSYLNNDYAITSEYNTDLATMLSLFYMTREDLETVIRYFDEHFNAVSYLLPVKKGEECALVYIRCMKNWYAAPVYFFSLYTEEQFFDTASIGDGIFHFYHNGRQIYTRNNKTAGSKKFYTEVRRAVSDTGLFHYELEYPYNLPITGTVAAIVLTGIAAAAGIILLMTRFTRRLYTPIENILRLTDYPVTAQDEFAYISHTIQTLNHEVDVMSSSLKNYDALLERNFLRELLCNYIPQEDAQLQIARLRLPEYSLPLSAAVIRYGNTDAYTASEQGIPYNTCYLVKQQLEQVLHNAGKQFPFFRIIDVSFDSHVVITDAAGDTLYGLLSGILAKHELTEDLGICTAIGYAVDTLWKIGMSYRNAVWLLEMQSYRGSGKIIITNNDFSGAAIKTTVYYSLAAEQTLINAVMHRKIELWQSVLTDIFIDNHDKDRQGIARLALLLNATVHRILDGIQKTPEEVFGLNTHLLVDITACKKHEDLYRLMKQVLIHISEHIRSSQKTANPFLVHQMEAFIKNNYMRNISLDDLATEVNLSPNYVSTTFKQCFGRNFKDYLNFCRYEAACKLICTDPSKKLKEVAAQCGCSTDILTRLFLKYGKILPADYQKQIRGG